MPKGDPIDAVLAPDGLLAGVIAGYEHRPQQIQMAHRVRAAIEDRRFLIVEAGTGTGKTLAYLLPALLSGRKVVVSTATKNLQEQIFFKDIPLLRKALGSPIDAALMKGRQNYLCKLKFERFSALALFATESEGRRWPEIRDWAAQTATGDRAEIDLPDDFLSWKELSTTSRACLGTTCAHYEACFVTRMRERARDAAIVVVNHHLFFADLTVRAAAGGARGAEVIPPYEAVVFDEAHSIDGIATEHFGVEVSPLRVSELSRDAASALAGDESLRKRVGRLLRKSEQLASAVFRDLVQQVLRGDRSTRVGPKAMAPFGDTFAELEDALDAVRGLLDGSDDLIVKSLGRRAGEVKDDLRFARRADEPSYVYWLEERERAAFLRAAPVDVARELRERLYSKIDTAIFTSATLAAGGRFDYALRQLGLFEPLDARPSTEESAPSRDGAAETVAFDSPFDFERQAALYAPKHLPDPANAGFVTAACAEIAKLCEITGGRAFCLFTSLRNMRAAHDQLRGRLPWRVLLQGDKPKQRLLEEFRETPSVLFASQSFWEGVDVPGQALSLVVIDKLPFAAPGDPIVAARVDWLRSQERDPFNEYQLPDAVISLRQGFGRLIRTRSDRGIVSILDPRLSSKAYGRVFLASLPRCGRFASIEDVADWWSRG
jgi:ATP-dependent DNA helicase DinG